MPGVSVVAVPDQGTVRELFRTEATPGDPLADLPRRRPRDRGRAAARRRRSRQRAGRDPAEHRRDPRGSQRTGHRWAEPGDVRPGRTRVDLQDREQPGAAARGADPRHRGAVHARRSSSTARSSRTTPTTRAAPSATSRCGRRWPTRATPPSSRRRRSCSGTDLFDAGVSLGIGLDHDLGFPAYFGSTDPDTDQRDRGCCPADRPGHDPGLADGDGHRDRLGAARVAGGAAAGRGRRRDHARGCAAARRERGRPRCSRCCEAWSPTAAAAASLDVPGPPVIAKTGTAEFGTGADLQTHAWMIAAQGDLAVVRLRRRRRRPAARPPARSSRRSSRAAQRLTPPDKQAE